MEKKFWPGGSIWMHIANRLETLNPTAQSWYTKLVLTLLFSEKIMNSWRIPKKPSFLSNHWNLLNSLIFSKVSFCVRPMWCCQDQYYGSVAKKETIKIIETLLQKDTFDRGRCGFLISPAISFFIPWCQSSPLAGLVFIEPAFKCTLYATTRKKSPFSAS